MTAGEGSRVGTATAIGAAPEDEALAIAHQGIQYARLGDAAGLRAAFSPGQVAPRVGRP